MGRINPNAKENGTYVVTATFTDENDLPVTPDTLKWSLFDKDGNVINGHDSETISPDTSVDIVLSGADLNISDGAKRYITIIGTYTSDAGAGLPINDEAHFFIDNLVGV